MKITSESVLEGHPDKVCDQISDAILDAYLQQDPKARVAVESFISDKLLVIAGEVRSTALVDIEGVANQVLKDIGYDSPEKGFDYHNYVLLKNIHEQSSDIAQGVDSALDEKESLGAGDQGLMFGYATDETADLMPLPLMVAHALSERLVAVRKSGRLPYLYPDGKTQVTVDYDKEGRPLSITDIVLSAQHHPDISQEKLHEDLEQEVIRPVLSSFLFGQSSPRLLINPTGRFVIGGPQGDTGLTGRKIIVDTYGGLVPHGGGAFSGKDPSKVDRSAAYMARYVAKNIVAAGLAKRCQVALSYAIGVAQPVAVTLNTFGTSPLEETLLAEIVARLFDMTPGGIINTLSLQQPIYQKTACYGHFKEGADLPWERTDKKDLLKKVAEAVTALLK